MSEDLLPSTSGPATRALAYTFDTRRRIAFLAPTIKQYGISILPDDWLPWLVYEFGLEDVVGYVTSFRQILAEGRIWQKRRGTPDGIRIGIGWVQSAGTVAPPDGRHDWWEFQIRFTQPPTSIDQMKRLVGIIDLSKASEDELFRMFSDDYDHRPVRLDRHRFDTGGLFDGYSGVPRWDGGPIISFGSVETIYAELDFELFASNDFETVTYVNFFGEGYRFDRDRFGQRPEATLDFPEESDGSIGILRLADTWPNVYPRSWAADGFTPLPVAENRVDETAITSVENDVWPNTYGRSNWIGGVTPIQTAATVTKTSTD